MSFKIRFACRDDCANIISLIQELADFENCSDKPKLKVDDLLRDGFGKFPAFHCLVAEHVDEAREDKKCKIVGYAFFYIIYGTWNGKSLFLEDVCVTQSYRKKGVGSALWNALMQELLKNNYGKLHFWVLNWNSEAIRFYEKRGAEDKTIAEKWICHRIERHEMEKTMKVGSNKSIMSFCKIRPATASDCPVIISMINELIAFAEDDEHSYNITLTADDLKRDGFGENPAFHVLLAEYYDEANNEQAPKIVGQAFYYYTYSTWYGKAAYLEDLYVSEAYRRKGIGTALWNALVQEALENNCCRIDFSVAGADAPFQFYEKKGAKNLMETEGWHFFRVTSEDGERCQRKLSSNLEALKVN